MRRAVLAAVILATIVLVTTIARAEPPGLTIAVPTTPAPWSAIRTVDTSLATIAPPVERVGYRGQLALADSSAIVLAVVVPGITGGGDQQSRAVFFGTYLAGAPLLHAANGHGWRALGSLALRAGLPLAGALLGRGIQGEPDCPPDASLCGDAVVEFGLILGAGAGMATALIVDYAALARPKPVRRGWSPVVAPTGSGAMAGVAGSF